MKLKALLILCMLAAMLLTTCSKSARHTEVKASSEDSKIIEYLNYGYGLDVGPIRSKETMDIVVSDAQCGSRVLWLEFDKQLDAFRKYTIYQDDDTLSHAWFEALFITDVDLDDKQDVVVTSNRFPSAVVWFRNPGYPDNTKKRWKLFPITHDFHDLEKWSNRQFDQDGRFYSATTFPQKKSGRLYPDIITAPNNQDGDGLLRVKWFHHPGPDSILCQTKWKSSIVGSGFGDVRTVKSFPVDSEVSWQIFINDHGHNTSYVYIRNETEWAQSVVSRRACAPGHGVVADINGDGRQDFLVASGYRCETQGLQNNLVAWYDGNGYYQEVIYDSAHSPLEVAAKDIGNDGIMDVIFGTAYTPNEQPESKLIWCKNTKKSPGKWECTTLKDSLVVVNAIRIADVNRDGNDDIIAVSSGNKKQIGRLMWFSGIPKGQP